MDELDKTIDKLKAIGFSNERIRRQFEKTVFVTDTLCYQFIIEFDRQDAEKISENSRLAVYFGEYQACCWVKLLDRRKPATQKIEDFLRECYQEVTDKMVKAASLIGRLSITLV